MGHLSCAVRRTKGSIGAFLSFLIRDEVGGTHPTDVAKDLGIPIPTLYRWVPARQQ